MSRKSKIDSSLKVKLVEMYLRDEIVITEGCRLAGLGEKTASSFRRWVNIYQNEGPAGLDTTLFLEIFVGVLTGVDGGMLSSWPSVRKHDTGMDLFVIKGIY